MPELALFEIKFAWRVLGVIKRCRLEIRAADQESARYLLRRLLFTESDLGNVNLISVKEKL